MFHWMGGGLRDLGFQKRAVERSCLEVDLIKMVWVDGSEVALEGLARLVGDDTLKTFLGEIEDSRRSDEDGCRPNDWADSCLVNFSKFLGMLTVGYDVEILKLLRKLKVGKEIKSQYSAFRKRKVCLSKFERELRKLECSVNYHQVGRARKGGKKG